MPIPDKATVFGFRPTCEDGRFIGSAERERWWTPPRDDRRQRAAASGDGRVVTLRPANRSKPRVVADWLCTAAAFAIVLGVVLGAGPDRRPATSGARDAGDGSQQTAFLSSTRGSP